MKQRYESITETSRLFRKKIMLLTIFNVNINEIKKVMLKDFKTKVNRLWVRYFAMSCEHLYNPLDYRLSSIDFKF